MNTLVKNQSCSAGPEPIHQRRIFIIIGFAALTIAIFWVFSRYPSLLSELDRAEDGRIATRELGLITKSELVTTNIQEGSWMTILKTTWNWIYANKYGMSFGIIFGGIFMALLGYLAVYKKAFQHKGIRGSLIGLLVGMPLGVCANCVAPIGLGMKKRGVGLATTLATMFASPTMNPIALIIIFMAFPLQIAITRVAAVLILIVGIVPILAHLFGFTDIPEKDMGVKEIKESWIRATGESLKAMALQVLKLALWAIPLMILAGFLGAVVSTYIPLGQLPSLINSPALTIAAAAIIGAFLPVPIFADIVFSTALMQAGLPLGVVAATLITLPVFSIYSASIVAKFFNWRLSALIMLIVIALGAFGGLIVNWI